MDVRKIVKTTISVTVLATGFVFFRIYYMNLLSILLNRIYKSEVYFEIITEKLFPVQYLGNYFPVLFYICIISILTARFIDVVRNHKYAINVLSSFAQPLILTVIVTIALSVNILNILQLWGILYILLIISLHSTFNMIILQTESIGSYSSLKLFKDFVLTIKRTIQEAISNAFSGFRNPVDETATLLISGIILLLEITVIISFIIYMATHWRLIFLSHLLNLR